MTDENDSEPVVFDSRDGEGQTPDEFVEGQSEPPDDESED